MLIGLLFFAFPIHAETFYVNDVLYVTLRDAPADDAAKIKILKSGFMLEKLADGDGGYIQVKTASGEEGWIKKRYLVTEPIAALKLNAVTKKLEEITQKYETLKKKSQTTLEQADEMEKERLRLESKSTNLEKDLNKLKQISKQPAEIAQQNKSLQKKINILSAELNQLRDQKQSFTKTVDISDWFVKGGMILGGSFILGFIFSNIRWRKKRDWV